MVRGLRTPVCSPRYEIGWDHFDASMSSYISLSLPLFLSPNALKTSLTLRCTFVRTCVHTQTHLCGCVSTCAFVLRVYAACGSASLQNAISPALRLSLACVRTETACVKSPRLYLTLKQISLIVASILRPRYYTRGRESIALLYVNARVYLRRPT